MASLALGSQTLPLPQEVAPGQMGAERRGGLKIDLKTRVQQRKRLGLSLQASWLPSSSFLQHPLSHWRHHSPPFAPILKHFSHPFQYLCMHPSHFFQHFCMHPMSKEVYSFRCSHIRFCAHSWGGRTFDSWGCGAPEHHRQSTLGASKWAPNTKTGSLRSHETPNSEKLKLTFLESAQQRVHSPTFTP